MTNGVNVNQTIVDELKRAHASVQAARSRLQLAVIDGVGDWADDVDDTIVSMFIDLEQAIEATLRKA